MRMVFLAVLASLVIGPMAAAAPQSDNGLPPAMLALKNRVHLTIIKKFPTRDPSLTGYVVKDPSGQTRLLFGMGPYVFTGVLIDANGNNATRAFEDAELPKPDYASAVRLLEKDTHLLDEGRKGAPEVYVFADPNCIFCHRFWKETRNWVRDGKIQLRWVMVGFLKATSPGRAAAILAAKDRPKALAEDETGFDVKQEEGGIKPLDPIPADIRSVLNSHGRMMAKLNFQGTPSLLYRDRQGQWQGQVGLPKGDTLPREVGFKP